MSGSAQNYGPIGSAVSTLIGYKRTEKQTNKTDKQNIYRFRSVLHAVCSIQFQSHLFFYIFCIANILIHFVGADLYINLTPCVLQVCRDVDDYRLYPYTGDELQVPDPGDGGAWGA